MTAKNKQQYDRETIKENWEKWDFVSKDTFTGKYLGQKQVLKEAGIEDDDGKAGDIELLGFEELNTGDKYGIINSGVLQTVDFVKGSLYEIVYKGRGESKKTGRKVNLFDIFRLIEKK